MTFTESTTLLVGLAVFGVGSLLIWCLRLWIEVRFLKIQHEADERWINVYADFATRARKHS